MKLFNGPDPKIQVRLLDSLIASIERNTWDRYDRNVQWHLSQGNRQESFLTGMKALTNGGDWPWVPFEDGPGRTKQEILAEIRRRRSLYEAQDKRENELRGKKK